MRIIRTIMMLTGAGVFLPSPPDDVTAAKTPQAQTETAAPGLIGSATLAIADAAGFCGRQPAVCQTAGYVAGRLQAKTKYSVRLIYEWASDSKPAPKLVPQSTIAGADPLTTGATSANPVRVASGQSTLRIEDLIPEWRGPQAARKG